MSGRRWLWFPQASVAMPAARDSEFTERALSEGGALLLDDRELLGAIFSRLVRPGESVSPQAWAAYFLQVSGPLPWAVLQ
jgi:hypothetical protein